MSPDTSLEQTTGLRPVAAQLMIRQAPVRPGWLTILCALLGVSALLAGESKPVLALWTHGGPGADQFVVRVTSSHHLSESHFSLPMTATGLTEAKHSGELTQEQFEKLISLALGSTDFDEGCGVVADGTSADLAVTSESGSTERTCRGASKWPVGSKTRSFLDALNRLLPREFNVF